MENAGWMAMIIVGAILAIVMGLYRFSGGGEDDANKVRIRYEDYTPAEAQYVKDALQKGCKFDRLYSLQQAGYKPYHVVMYVKLWELRGNTATKSWYLSKMNMAEGQNVSYGLGNYNNGFASMWTTSGYQPSAEERTFNRLWDWCVREGYLVPKYCTPSNGGSSMLMYENRL